MKKFTLLALAGLASLSAAAQYSCDPTNATVIAQKPKTVDYIVLADNAVNEFTNGGTKVEYIGPAAELGRNLWYWENTFNAYPETMPRVDFEEGGYICVEVGNVGWSGAGLAVDAPGVDLSHVTMDTRFHLAYMTPSGNGPASIALILLDKSEKGSIPAKFAIGDPFVDNGAVFPAVAPKINDEWQGLDIKLGDLKKLWPNFNLANMGEWDGNLFSWLGGGVAGQTMAFDAVYFYNVGEGSGVVGVADEMDLVVTNHTVNSSVAGIACYDLSGKLVKESNGTVLGLDNLTAGVYVVKSGSKTAKVVVK